MVPERGEIALGLPGDPGVVPVAFTPGAVVLASGVELEPFPPVQHVAVDDSWHDLAGDRPRVAVCVQRRLDLPFEVEAER